MNRKFQLLSLVAVLSLVSWLGSSGSVQARNFPPCSNYQGKTCSAMQDSVACGQGDYMYICDCDDFLGNGHYVWSCNP